MTDKIAVVKPYYRTEEAYRMGYDRFDGVAEEVDNPDEFDLSPYQSTAEYANTILPNLRAMAGYDDRGHGTYQENRKIAAIRPGCEEDEPAEAELTEAHHLFSELVDAFTAGAYDAAAGREPDPDNI